MNLVSDRNLRVISVPSYTATLGCAQALTWMCSLTPTEGYETIPSQCPSWTAWLPELSVQDSKGTGLHCLPHGGR